MSVECEREDGRGEGRLEGVEGGSCLSGKTMKQEEQKGRSGRGNENGMDLDWLRVHWRRVCNDCSLPILAPSLQGTSLQSAGTTTLRNRPQAQSLPRHTQNLLSIPHFSLPFPSSPLRFPLGDYHECKRKAGGGGRITAAQYAYSSRYCTCTGM